MPPSTPIPALVARLHALRAEYGLSQVAIARELGLSVRTVERWESGSQPPESPRLLELAISGLRAALKRRAKRA